MSTYEIESTQGTIFGDYKGESPAEALLSMHRDAGYSEKSVWLEDDELHFASESDQEACGGVDDWHITEAKKEISEGEVMVSIMKKSLMTDLAREHFGEVWNDEAENVGSSADPHYAVYPENAPYGVGGDGEKFCVEHAEDGYPATAYWEADDLASVFEEAARMNANSWTPHAS